MFIIGIFKIIKSGISTVLRAYTNIQAVVISQLEIQLNFLLVIG